jgi:hypothetical protein
MAIKEIHGDILNEDSDDITFESKWYNQNQVTDAFKKWAKEEYPHLTDAQISAAIEANLAEIIKAVFKTIIGTIDGDTMTIDGDTYTKQGGGSGGSGGGGQGGENIYLVGSGGYNDAACYWKNGVVTYLPVPAGSMKSYATDIDLSGSDVYIAGYYVDSNWENHPCHWKNGVRTDISLPEGVLWHSIAVSRGDIYVTGKYNTGLVVGGTGLIFAACYLKNGVKINLPVPEGAGQSLTDRIAVSGNDVCVAGEYKEDARASSYYDYTTSCYWKNGVRTDITSSRDGNYVKADYITVSGGNVYFTGSRASYGYWKNGVKIGDLPVPAGSRDSLVKGIAVSGSDVYVAGQYDDSNYNTHSCYWKNGARTDLPVPAKTESSSTIAITVSGGNVYILGLYSGLWGPVGERIIRGCYWKNGTRIELSGGNMNDAIIAVGN